jgi:hypothetical protein
MQRTAVNPWQWSVEMGFNQGEVVTGGARTLYLAGQTSMSAEGQPQHPGDMAANSPWPPTTSRPSCIRRA